MRVYLPATLTMLADLAAGGEFVPVSGTAFAVTPTLREAYTAGDEDELAEVAMREAARASLRLLAAEPAGELPVRRAVVAADVTDAVLRPDLDDAVVRLPGAVGLGSVASVHVDGREAEEAVRRGIIVIDDADLGDEDAELAIGDVEDHDLGWYATQELPFLLDLL